MLAVEELVKIYPSEDQCQSFLFQLPIFSLAHLETNPLTSAVPEGSVTRVITPVMQLHSEAPLLFFLPTVAFAAKKGLAPSELQCTHVYHYYSIICSCKTINELSIEVSMYHMML